MDKTLDKDGLTSGSKWGQDSKLDKLNQNGIFVRQICEEILKKGSK